MVYISQFLLKVKCLFVKYLMHQVIENVEKKSLLLLSKTRVINFS
jgi:hypothetical protein